jgi:hypothetical protein
MQNDRYGDYAADDAQGFEDILYQPPTAANGDNDKFQKKPRR